MNVYDMDPDCSQDGKWTWFFTKNGLAMPSMSAERPAFFEAHPRIAVDRNTDSTPRGSKAELADYSNLSNDVHPVFSQRAKDLLFERLEGLGRWIELDYDEAPYWLFYITNVVDALDESKSKILRFTDSGKVMRVAQYVFQPDKLQGQFLFTLPQRPGSNRLVTDEFVDIVREHRLTGFWFELLWSSETGPTPMGLKDWEKPRITGLERA